MAEKLLFPASILDEALYYAEKAAGVSMIHGCIYTLKGEVSSRTVQKALDACLNYYAKCKCILVNKYPSIKRYFRYAWEYQDIKGSNIMQEIKDPSLDADGEGALAYYIKNHSSLSIDITCHVPVRVVLIRQAEQASLIFVFHHAAVDGIGSFCFIQRFIQFYEEIFYQQKTSGHAAPSHSAISQPEIKPPWSLLSLRQFSGLRKEKVFSLQEPLSQKLPQGGAGPASTFLAVLRKLSTHQFEKVSATAKKYQTTINTYLVAVLFQTLRKWNLRYGNRPGYFCINIPVNLRTADNHGVGNFYSGLVLSLKSEVLDDLKKTVQLIREKQQFMIEHDVPWTTVKLTWFLKMVPLTIKSFMSKQHLYSFSPSLGLSNLGTCSPNPSHKNKEGYHYMGSARISAISGLGIANPWPQIRVLTYNERMTITLSVAHAHFSFEKAERFLDSYIQELME